MGNRNSSKNGALAQKSARLSDILQNEIYITAPWRVRPGVLKKPQQYEPADSLKEEKEGGTSGLRRRHSSLAPSAPPLDERKTFDNLFNSLRAPVDVPAVYPSLDPNLERKVIDAYDKGSLFIQEYSQDFMDRVKHDVDDLQRRGAGDRDLIRAVADNFYELLATNQYIANRLFTSSPCIDLKLDATETYVGYKIACFDMHNTPPCEILKDVAVLITLYIEGRGAFVAEGATGKRVKPEDFKPGVKYCTKEAIVAGIQFLGNIQSVEKAMRAYDKGQGRIVSNFDSEFEYILGHKVHVPDFGQPGRKCVKGVHLFIDKPSTLKYVKTGYIEDVLTPVISAVRKESRMEDTYRDAGFPAERQFDLKNVTVANIEAIIDNLYKTTKSCKADFSRLNYKSRSIMGPAVIPVIRV